MACCLAKESTRDWFSPNTLSMLVSVRLEGGNRVSTSSAIRQMSWSLRPASLWQACNSPTALSAGIYTSQAQSTGQRGSQVVKGSLTAGDAERGHLPGMLYACMGFSQVSSEAASCLQGQHQVASQPAETDKPSIRTDRHMDRILKG